MDHTYTMKQFDNPFRLNDTAYQLFNTNFWKYDSQNQKQNKSKSKSKKYPLILSGGSIMCCVHHKPNIFVINNFLTDLEINHLLNISRCNAHRFELSYTQSSASGLFHKIYTKHRTSTCIFLQKSMDAIVSNIEDRAANIVGASKQKVEEIQIVRYTKGQHFHLHHDAGTLMKKKNKEHSMSADEYTVDILWPLRVHSLFVYLTSLEEGDGGETYFPEIGLKIRPQRGTAVLWCNVDVNNVFNGDPMLMHRANEVSGKQEKLAMNIWIQQQ